MTYVGQIFTKIGNFIENRQFLLYAVRVHS